VRYTSWPSTEDDFLVAAGTALIAGGHFDAPALVFAKADIHPEQVAGKNGGFITARATPDFYNGVFAIFRIGRYQKQLDGFFQRRKVVLAVIKLLLGHFFKVRVGFRCQ